MNINCIIVDDEPLAIEVLTAYIERIEIISLEKSFRNAISAFEFLQVNTVDLVFLDIQMPKLTGINLLKTLTNPPKVIFTTAYREYALEGFELEAVDYLLKPIPFERFLKAVNKYLDNNTNQYSSQDVSGANDPFIYFKVDKKMVKVRLSEILYIESIKDYVKVATENKEIVTHQKISYMELKLSDEKFIRVHRSFIVSKDKIDAYSASEIEIGKHHIPIGRNYKHEVLQKLGVNQIL